MQVCLRMKINNRQFFFKFDNYFCSTVVNVNHKDALFFHAIRDVSVKCSRSSPGPHSINVPIKSGLIRHHPTDTYFHLERRHPLVRPSLIWQMKL